MATRLERYEYECFAILFNGCKSRSSIHGTANVLVSCFTHFNVNPCLSRAYLYYTLVALRRLAIIDPTSIDFLLRVYDNFCKGLPQTIAMLNCRGNAAGQQSLYLWLRRIAERSEPLYDRRVIGHPRIAGSVARSSSSDDAEPSTKDMLANGQEWKDRQTRFIVSMAITGRCLSYGLFMNDGRARAYKLISSSFRRQLDWNGRHKDWSPGDVIAKCFLLRGCAKTLLYYTMGGDGLRQAWIRRLQNFQKENRKLTIHTNLAIRNLIEGPWDESSEELFKPGYWMFI